MICANTSALRNWERQQAVEEQEYEAEQEALEEGAQEELQELLADPNSLIEHVSELIGQNTLQTGTYAMFKVDFAKCLDEFAKVYFKGKGQWIRY